MLQGSGLSWLFPFVDGHPPIGWHDAGLYLVLPALLVLSQFASQKLVTPQNTDPAQQQTQAILGFLPFMIGKCTGVRAGFEEFRSRLGLLHLAWCMWGLEHSMWTRDPRWNPTWKHATHLLAHDCNWHMIATSRDRLLSPCNVWLSPYFCACVCTLQAGSP
jgi:hypothetical protein